MNNTKPSSQTKNSSLDYSFLVIGFFLTPYILFFYNEIINEGAVYGINLFLHLSIYLMSLCVLIAHFVLSGLKKDLGVIEYFIPIIFFINVIWDTVDPLTGIQSFLLLKSIFYFLFFLQVPYLSIGKQKFFSISSKPKFISILLIATSLIFLIQQRWVFASIQPSNDDPVFESLAGNAFEVLMIFIIALIYPIPTLSNQQFPLEKFKREIVLCVSFVVFIITTYRFLYAYNKFAGIYNFQGIIWSGRELTYLKPICLYLFILTKVFIREDQCIKVRNTIITLLKPVSVLFSFSFFITSIASNLTEINSAINRVIEYKNEIGIFGNIVIVLFSIITGAMTFVEFGKKKT